MTEYHSPQLQSGGGGQKNFLLVIGVTIAVLLLAQQYFFKQPPPEQKPAAPAPAATQQNAVPAPPPPPPAPRGSKRAGAQPGAKQAGSESVTVVENDLYRITFSNRGGLAKSWILKKYKDSSGNPLNLVNEAAAGEWGYPLSLWSWDEGLRTKLNSVLYVPSATGTLNSPGELTFEYADGDLTVRKSFHFDSTYVVKVETSVVRGGNYQFALPAWPAGFGDASAAAAYAAQTIDFSNGEKIQRLKPDKKGKEISNGNVLRGTFEWGGAVDQYFTAMFLPDRPQHAVLATLRNFIVVPKDPKKPNETEKHEVLGVAVGDPGGVTSGRIFVGPKADDVLNSLHANTLNGQPNGADLSGLIDWGFFSIIARPLFLWLKWTHEHWVNFPSGWGWAIIILTLIINAAMLPLRLYQMKSALEMQRIQPQIQAIQAKYKKYPMRDPRRAEMNQEVSALYREHKVNPASGCLPLLVQMPFLWAFYRMLSEAIELRQAQFYWLHDLSSPDHWLVLPILIVLSTLLMQKMTPQAGISKEQQRMMNLMMPLMLGFFSWSVASGLGLYWVVGTLVGILQQWVMNRTKLGQEIHALAEKRARKQAGTGVDKTDKIVRR
ncbi:MAG: membrane protein insertase YidC [Candidatus Korobacteraceae bacterium]